MKLSLWDSFAAAAKHMAEKAFSEFQTRDDWERARPALHLEFMRSLGLEPLPSKCDLAVQDCGELRGDGFTGRKLAYQILPGCWGSGVIYYPAAAAGAKLPAVLYVCGHNPLGTCGYQAHAINWARRGFVCLSIDTIEQNDNPGEHGGMHLGHWPHWTSMGYTPAGAEVFNAMRALDLLEADPRVDANQLGINGVSGGGACSFHTAIADTRVKAVSTLCGICSPYDAIANWHLTGHCECMFPINLYKRDISVYAGLIAPRAVQFGFALHDSLFHPEETRALAHRARTAYTLLGCEDRWKLVEAPGPHGNQPAFDAAAAKWFDLHLAGVEQPPLKVAKPVFTESEISVFNGTPPAPDRLDILPQLLTPYGTLPLPSKPDEWPEIRQSAVSRLRAAVPCLSTLEEERRSQLKVSADWRYNGELKSSSTILLQGEIQGVGVRLRLYAPAGAVRKLLLAVGSEGEYLPWIDGRVHPLLPDKCVNVAGLQARLAGANLPPEPKTGAPGLPPLRNYYVRAMQLLGTSTVAMTFHDIGVALNALAECDGTSGCEIYLYGCGDSGIAALYRGILDDRVSGVIVEDVPASHRYGAPLPGVLRAFDLQHAFGLLAPRKIAMVNRGYKRCLWAQRLYERLGCPGNCLHAADLRQALAFML